MKIEKSWIRAALTPRRCLTTCVKSVLFILVLSFNMYPKVFNVHNKTSTRAVTPVTIPRVCTTFGKAMSPAPTIVLPRLITWDLTENFCSC